MPAWYASPCSQVVTGVERGVQTRASVEVTTIPFSPTATYFPSAKTTLLSRSLVPLAVARVHPRPSGEVRISPASPTITNWPPPYVTATSQPVEPDSRGSHVAPLSEELRMTPRLPTVTISPAPAAMLHNNRHLHERDAPRASSTTEPRPRA